MKYLTALILILVSFNLFAQDAFQYQLKGSYKLKSADKKAIDYTLRWSENKGKITGDYSDNFFIDSASVKGDQGNMGRNFIVELPSIKNGVKSITLLSSEAKSDLKGTTVPVSIVTRDRRGNPLTTAKGNSNLVTLYSVAQKQEESPCQEGFGALAGYCGIYEGLISEFQDKRNKCNLLFASAVRLELTNDQTMILHLGEVNDLVNIPYHVIGRLPSNPERTSIDVMSRSCRPLQGVNAPGDACKQLNLTGTFSIEGTNKHFAGAYSIKEEGTNNLCQYTLSMDLENQ
jgi:hypothetical protein